MRDPIGYAQGEWNLYGYTDHSPLTGVDPLGLFPNQEEATDPDTFVDFVIGIEGNHVSHDELLKEIGDTVAAGADFGDNLNPEQKLSDQLRQWLKENGARKTSDPETGYDQLPRTDLSRGAGSSGAVPSRCSSDNPRNKANAGDPYEGLSTLELMGAQ